MSQIDKMLSDAAVAEALDKSPRTLERWRQLGYGPRYVRIGRTRRTHPDELAAWLADRTYSNKAEELAKNQPRRRGRPRKSPREALVECARKSPEPIAG